MNYTVFKGGKRLNTFATTVYPAPYNETNNCEFVLFTQDEKTTAATLAHASVAAVVCLCLRVRGGCRPGRCKVEERTQTRDLQHHS